MKEVDRKPISFGDPTIAGDLAQRLLEAQCQQNQRMKEVIRQQQESTLAPNIP